MSASPLRVLVVDDEASLRDPLAEYLRKEHGFQVDTAASADEAWQKVTAAQGQYDVALIDDMLTPGPRGLDVMKRIKAAHPEIEAIIFTAWGGDWALEYLQAGAYRHLRKPFDSRELGFLIQTAAEHAHIRKEKDRLRSLYEASSSVISTTDPQAVLEVIVRHALKALDGWWAKLVLIAEDGTPTASVVIGRDQEIDIQALIRPHGISRQVMDSGQPYCIEDVEQARDRVNPRLLQDGVGAAICVPLHGQEKNIGVVWIHYREPRRFLPQEIDALQLYATQAAIAYINARLLDERDRARHASGVIAKVTVLDDLQRTLDMIVRATQDVLRYDAIVLYSYDQERDEIGHRASHGVRLPERMPPVGKLDRRSALWKALKMEETFYLAEDAQNDSITAGRFVREENVVSSIIFPLKFGDRKVGALFVNYRTAHRFTEGEIATISLFADQAAVAIRYAQLFIEYEQQASTLKALFTEYEQQATTLEALYNAGQKVSATLDLEQILNEIVFQSWTLAGQYGPNPTLCTIMLKEDQRLRFAATYPEERLTQLRHKVGPYLDLETGHDGRIGISGLAAETRQSVLMDDVSKHPDYIEIDPQTRSELAVPIKFGGRVIGVINVEHPGEGAFNEQDRQALESLAAQAAIAIENARKYEELRDTYEELQRTESLVGSRTALAWMGMINSTWRHAIEGHAVNILNSVHLLRQNLSTGADDETVEKRLCTIERLARKVQEKPITPPISSEEGVHPLCINNLVRERVQQLWQYPPHNVVTCQWNLANDEEVTVRASPEWLRRVLDILLDNAVEAMEESPIKELTIATQQADRRMRLTISDTGPGIPPGIKAQLFNSPIEKSPGEKGLGMGLLMAQMIAQTYRGDISVGRTGPKGTAMVLELPIEDD